MNRNAARLAALVLLGIAPSAAAKPPRPLLLPDLSPGTDIAGSAGVGNTWPDSDHNDTLIDLDVDPRLRLNRFVEAFADAGVFYTTSFDPEGGLRSFFGLRNLRLGFRAAWPASARGVTVSVGAWSWLPVASTQGHRYETHFGSRESADLVRGLPDPYAMYDGLAAGGALDLGWRDSDTFVQGEIGSTLVRDLGVFEVDDLLAAIGAGTRLSTRLAAVGEVRLVQQPTGAQYAGNRWWAASFGLARTYPDGSSLRVRVGIGIDATESGPQHNPELLLFLDGALPFGRPGAPTKADTDSRRR